MRATLYHPKTPRREALWHGREDAEEVNVVVELFSADYRNWRMYGYRMGSTSVDWNLLLRNSVSMHDKRRLYFVDAEAFVACATVLDNEPWAHLKREVNQMRALMGDAYMHERAHLDDALWEYIFGLLSESDEHTYNQVHHHFNSSTLMIRVDIQPINFSPHNWRAITQEEIMDTQNTVCIPNDYVKFDLNPMCDSWSNLVFSKTRQFPQTKACLILSIYMCYKKSYDKYFTEIIKSAHLRHELTVEGIACVCLCPDQKQGKHVCHGGTGKFFMTKEDKTQFMHGEYPCKPEQAARWFEKHRLGLEI